MSFGFLNSRIFPSWSTADLHASTQNITHTYSYGYAATELTLPLRNPTQVSLLDRPDESITALPPQVSTGDVQNTQGHRQTTSQPTEEVRRESKWDRIKASAKAKWKRIAKKRRHDMVIGKPTDFKRVGGTELLAKSQPRSEEPDQEDDWDNVSERQRV